MSMTDSERQVGMILSSILHRCETIVDGDRRVLSHMEGNPNMKDLIKIHKARMEAVNEVCDFIVKNFSDLFLLR